MWQTDLGISDDSRCWCRFSKLAEAHWNTIPLLYFLFEQTPFSENVLRYKNCGEMFLGTGQDIVERPSNYRGRARVYYAVVKYMGLIVGSKVNAEPFAWRNVFCVFFFYFFSSFFLSCRCLTAGFGAFIWNNLLFDILNCRSFFFFFFLQKF